MIAGVNLLAVLVCAVLSMPIGFIWFHPKVFFPAWWRGIGKTEADTPQPNPLIYVLTFLAAFVEAFIVGMLLDAAGVTSLARGLGVGFILWIGLVATTNLANNLFRGYGWKVWAIETGNHLVYLLLCGAILAVWP